MIAIVDYGLGNLRSAHKGLEKAGFSALVTDDPERIAAADAVVLPGVGAFRDCYEGLAGRNLIEPVKAAAASGKPFLGICVGLQLLFDGSEENPGCPGLGILPGMVVRFPDLRSQGLKVPHMGWNRVRRVPGRDCAIWPEAEAPHAYFVHSYFARPADDRFVLATSEHGIEFPAIVGHDNVYAVQFHPEKSQDAGIALLRAFGNLVGAPA